MFFYYNESIWTEFDWFYFYEKLKSFYEKLIRQ